jgi:hypothetical protein
MISKAVYSILSSNTTVTALVSTRIYPLRTPEAITQPFIIYKTTTDPIDTKDGASKQHLIDLDLTIFAKSYETAQTIYLATKTALDRYSGTVQTEKIQTIIFIDSRDSYDNSAELYRVDVMYQMRVNY